MWRYSCIRCSAEIGRKQISENPDWKIDKGKVWHRCALHRKRKPFPKLPEWHIATPKKRRLFHDNFIRLKHESRLSLRKLSALAHVSPKTIRKIERDACYQPPFAVVKRLASAMDVSYHELDARFPPGYLAEGWEPWVTKWP